MPKGQGQGRAGHSQIKYELRQQLGCLFGGMLSFKGITQHKGQARSFIVKCPDEVGVMKSGVLFFKTPGLFRGKEFHLVKNPPSTLANFC
jgi:hypothetical protein